ncbi:Kynurenine/alpha-aminoadipate aminotransferase, mitochondrial [Eufriesea mexicana]|uniref:Kynurenine/alpha-aminoadipate aminotransferase, mitochondrial n=1 Tax=Eufriesea mexicana TaxID=516756 RepID=A0A310S5U3_9HYME|nr:PREDICTED: kynurenine/alpha-aminoadipate aminotransferase, mitochondrial-like [Eufriesea mexicana]OAD52887.1 Kynurenine/alpha-aminoadipate aminotransferase, mitochondrial [Eufriesea mexicana]
MHKTKDSFEMDYTSFKTEVSKSRRSATTRELTKIAYSAPNHVISLAEGMPNEETFPFTEISIKLKDGSSFTLDDQELGAALQYIPSQGYPPLLRSLREYQRKLHAPPLWDSRDIVIVSGAQDGLSKTLEAIIGPGDPLLVHDPFYPGVEVVVSPHKAELIPIPQDEHGVDPKILRETLRNRELSGKKMPKIMYINATGLNPTGTVIPLERRKEIYRIACEYNFLILDDDPYFCLYYDDEVELKSFLSLDTEGRVIRLDSFSKVLSSGLRLGFITAAAPLIASIELHLQSSHLHAPTLSQVILYRLMKLWGYDGMMRHFTGIKRFYKQRRDETVCLAEKHLNGLADFKIPRGGFFLWINVRGIEDTWKMLMQRGIKEGVIMAPGGAFMKDPSKPCNAIRASFAKASYEDIELALIRLAKLIRDQQEDNYLYANGNTYIN